jgi:hypothetical protein
MTTKQLRSIGTACVVLAGLLHTVPAGAQALVEDFGPLAAGSRVRLTAPSLFDGRVEGLVLDVDEESILVGTEQGRPFRVSRGALTGLEVSTGRRGQALKGLAVGAVLGGALFAAYPREEFCLDYEGTSCPERAEMIATGVVGGGLWGLLIGHFTKTDRWSPVPAAGPRLSVAPTRGREGWGLRMAMGW